MSIREWFYSVPLSNVSWGGAELNAALRSMVTRRSAGTRDVELLEKMVRESTGAAGVVALDRGRTALKWILDTAKAQPFAEGRGRVIFPSMCCKAVLDAVKAAGLEPVLCDSTEDLAMDPDSAGALLDPEKTLALVVPHIYGRPSPMKEFNRMAEADRIVVVDDAAAAMGGRLDQVPMGLNGDAGLYSFSQGKAASAGGGGLALVPGGGLLTGALQAADPPLPARRWKEASTFRSFLWHDLWHRYSGPVERARSITKARLGLAGSKGRGGDEWEFRGMAGLQASVALAQFTRLASMEAERRQNMILLAHELSGVEEIRVLPVPEESTPTRFVVETPGLKVKRSHAGIEEENPLAVHLRKLGIEARYAYLPLHTYAGKDHGEAADLKTAQRLGESLVLLPFLPPLKAGELARIGKAVRSYFGR